MHLKREANLFIPFRTIVSFAQHLTIGECRCSPFAPRRYMVGIHLIEFIDTSLVGIVAQCTQGAVGHPHFIRMFCLPLVSCLLVFLLEIANIEQGRIRFSAKHIFIYIAWTPHRLIDKQRLDASREVIDTIRRSVVR